LAWESPADNIDIPAPLLAVEASHVIPDWERVKDSVALSRKQDASAVGINLNSADGAPSKQLSAQDASACSCK
jgi:hypothetical protein